MASSRIGVSSSARAEQGLVNHERGRTEPGAPLEGTSKHERSPCETTPVIATANVAPAPGPLCHPGSIPPPMPLGPRSPAACRDERPALKLHPQHHGPILVRRALRQKRKRRACAPSSARSCRSRADAAGEPGWTSMRLLTMYMTLLSGPPTPRDSALSSPSATTGPNAQSRRSWA